MPPSGSNNNNAAAQAAKAEREERLRTALTNFILKERKRQKEEFAAKVEEERLRLERQAKEREHDMTIEDTRSKITKIDDKLADLRNQKQQLFLQLKKVLNEDETRKKQQKDELLAFQNMQAQQANAAAPPPQIFLPPVRHHQMPLMAKPMTNQPLKRVRSPSPPAHQNYYKSTPYSQTKHDDGRRGADYARVLWNKPPTQYQTPGTLYYQNPPGSGPPPQGISDGRGAVIYPAYNLPLRPGYHLELQPAAAVVPVSKSDASPKPTQVYHINLDQPLSQTSSATVPGTNGSNVSSQKPQVTMEKISADRFHTIEVKHETGPSGHGPPPAATHGMPEAVVYTPLLPGMSLHPMQSNKSGGGLNTNYAPRNAATAHEQQMARQQQMNVLPQQAGSQSQQQQIHYPRRF